MLSLKMILVLARICKEIKGNNIKMLALVEIVSEDCKKGIVKFTQITRSLNPLEKYLSQKHSIRLLLLDLSNKQIALKAETKMIIMNIMERIVHLIILQTAHLLPKYLLKIHTSHPILQEKINKDSNLLAYEYFYVINFLSNYKLQFDSKYTSSM